MVTSLLRYAWLPASVLTIAFVSSCSSLSCGEGTVERGDRCVAVVEPDVVDALGFEGVQAAAPASATSILVAWLPSARPEVTYRIYVATSEDGFNYAEHQAVAPAGAATVIVGGLEEDTAYYVNVRAVLEDVEAPNDVLATTTTAEDTESPRFEGVASAEPAPGAAVVLSWEPASDDLTPSGALLYYVFAGPDEDSIDRVNPIGVSLPGATSTRVALPEPETEYAFWVQARDAAGNFDGNEEHLTATSGEDVEAPVFTGCKAAVARSARSLLVSWEPASDDIAGAADLTYNVYASETVDGFNFLAPDATVTGATQVLVPNLTRDTQYYVVCRAADPSGNEDDNLRLQTARTKNDDVPPEFGGIVTVANVTPTTVDLTWNAATDNQTRTEDIVYDVFVARDPDAFDFEEDEPWMTSAPGATSLTVEALDTNTNYYVVVVARDEGENRSAPEPPAAVSTLVSFQLDVLGIFAAKQCTACHGGTSPVVLSLSATAAYEALVDVDATTGLGAGYKRVEPGNSADSHLVHRIKGTGPLEALDDVAKAAARMPQDGNYLSAAQIATIELWIAQGAVDN